MLLRSGAWTRQVSGRRSLTSKIAIARGWEHHDGDAPKEEVNLFAGVLMSIRRAGHRHFLSPAVAADQTRGGDVV